MNNTFCKFVSLANLNKTAPLRGLLPAQLVRLSVKVSGEAVVADNATLSDGGTSEEAFLCRRLPSHNLPCSEECDKVAIRAPKNQDQCKSLSYQYPFGKSREVPRTPGNVHTGGFCVWHTCSMRAVSAPAVSKPALPAGPHLFVPPDVESSPQDFVEASIADDVAGKKVPARPLDRRTYRPREVWITIFQVDEAQNPLRAVLRKHEGDLLGFLPANEYQYGAGSTTAASL